MQLMNQLKYPLINLLVVDAADEPAEIPFDEPFGS
jgi:hypothetical protein